MWGDLCQPVDIIHKEQHQTFQLTDSLKYGCEPLFNFALICGASTACFHIQGDDGADFYPFWDIPAAHSSSYPGNGIDSLTSWLAKEYGVIL